jgi:hypothetical protein
MILIYVNGAKRRAGILRPLFHAVLQVGRNAVAVWDS